MKLYSTINYFLFWLIFILFVSYFGFSTLPHSDKFNNNFWGSLANWDGGHYLGIAEKGYSEKFQYAFFPLYPLIVRAVAQITQNYLFSAILVSIISTSLGVLLLYKLVLIYFDKKIADKTILNILFFPTSFYFLTAYSEGLFFFLAVSTFYFLGKNRLFWATVMAALASATRFAGLAIVTGLWIEIFTTQGINRKNWYIIFAPLGLILYCLYLNRQTGDLLYFLTAENHWQRSLATPGISFWETIRNISSGFNFNIFLDLIFAVLGLGLAIRSLRFLPLSFSVYSLISIGIPLLTSTLTSIPRFLLVIFPIFILLALIKNRFVTLAFQFFSLALLIFFTLQFILGFWVS